MALKKKEQDPKKGRTGLLVVAALAFHFDRLRGLIRRRTTPAKAVFIGRYIDEAFSVATVPREPWAPKRESSIVSLFGALGSFLRQA